MAVLTELERLRLYLRDDRTSQRFTDPQLLQLLEDAETAYGAPLKLYGAAAIGWLMRAGDIHERIVSASYGRVSETRTQGYEAYAAAIRMYRHYLGLTGSTLAQFLEVQPAVGLIADLQDIEETLRATTSSDLSRFEW